MYRLHAIYVQCTCESKYKKVIENLTANSKAKIKRKKTMKETENYEFHGVDKEAMTETADIEKKDERVEGTEPEYELDLWEGQFSLTDSTNLSNSTQSLSTSTHVGAICSSKFLILNIYFPPKSFVLKWLMIVEHIYLQSEDDIRKYNSTLG